MGGMSDDIGGKVEAAFKVFESKASQIAAKVGCSVGPRLFESCYDNPVLVPDKKVAEARAETLLDTAALTGEVNPYARVFRDIKNSSCTGRVGFARDGTPLVCLLKGTATVSDTKEVLGYLSIVTGYAIYPISPKAHRKRSSIS